MYLLSFMLGFKMEGNINMKRFATLVATLGVGRWLPYFGTFGSLISLPVCYFAIWLFHSGIAMGPLLYSMILILVFWAGVWSVPIAEKELGPMKDPFGNERLHDHNQIGIDETLGMLISTIPLLFLTQIFWWHYAAVFVVFRIFDILKIWPAKYFDRMQNAWGVMLDDAVSGTYSAICIALLILVI